MLSSPGSREGQAAPAPRYWLRDEPPDLNDSDAFAVSRMVDRLVSLVKASPAPFTLSLSGSWGIGKSTIAEALVKRVRVGPEPMKACLVDAWTEDVDHLRRTLAIAVGAELRGGEEHREEVAIALDEPVRSSHGKSKPKAELALPDSLRSIPRRPAPFLIAVLIIEALVILALIFAGDETLKIFLPVVTTLLGATLVAAALQTGFVFRVETSTETQAPAVESVHMARQFADAVTGKADGVSAEKVLVVVDNLDRLPGKDALHALAEIRSLVEIKGSRCVFLIPVDRAAFAGHLQSALSGDVSAKDYLDKFFNLDVLLTQPEPLDVRDWATEQATPLFADVASPEEIAAAVQVVASMANGSPRSVKRIINGVSTRLRMLDASVAPRPTLAQLSFVEGLIVRFPEMVAWLESEPRNFTDARASITAPSGGTNQDEELARVLSGAGLAPNRSTALRAILLRNTDIDMPAGLIRLVMALREDRAWKGLADPQAIREALETGEATAYAAALDAIEPGLRPMAVSRSVGWVERSVPSFPRDAMTNLIAIAGRIADYPSAADHLRPTAMRVMRRMDGANLTRITPDLALFVLGEQSSDHAARAGVAAAYAGLAGSDDFDGPWVDGVIQALRLGSDDITQPSLKTLRARLAGLPDDVVDAVWNPSVDLNLASGAMVEAYVTRLVALPALDDTEPLVLRRMVEFAKAAGLEPSLTQLAAAIQKQVAAVVNVPVEAVPYLDLVIDALSNTTGSEIDALASVLATPPRVDSGRVLAMALRLNATAAVRKSIVAEVDEWLALAALTSDDARLLLESHSSALSTDGVDIAGHSWRSGLRVAIRRSLNLPSSARPRAPMTRCSRR